MSTTKELHPDENVELGSLGPKVVAGAGIIGLAALGVSVALGASAGDGFKRFFFSYLVAFAFFLSIALGALFFVILDHLTRSIWSVVLRRIAEILTATFPVLGLLALVIVLPMLLGNHQLYFWTTAGAEHEHLIHAKLGFLNTKFFTIRLIVYFVVWILLSRFFFGKSVEQGRSGDASISDRLRRGAGPSMIGFALTLALGAFDLLMSLHPAWYSTMFGVYYFAGAGVIIYATLGIIARTLQGSGRLRHSITTEHYHDIGKMLFGFVFFWGYIAFSQFMLIWYANIPEETVWYHYRMFTSWDRFSWALLIGHFAFPFLFLLSRWTKRINAALMFFCVWMFAVHYLDIYWLVMPEYDQTGSSFGLIDITTLFGIGGIFVAAAARAAQRVKLIADKDPRLSESLAFENY